MTEDGSRQSPPDLDGDTDSLGERIARADHVEAVRTGKTVQGVDPNYRMGNRVLADLIGGIAGGMLFGWLFDRLFGTSPWLLIVFLCLGIIVAFRNIIRISNEHSKRHAPKDAAQDDVQTK